MACLTAYIIYLCTETHYEKCLKKVSRFVHEQNEQVTEIGIKKNPQYLDVFALTGY